MPYVTDSPARRTLGPAVASVVVGLALGVVAVIGISTFTGQGQVRGDVGVESGDALLGGPEYGSRG